MSPTVAMDGRVVSLLRRDDLLVLDFALVNLSKTAAETGGEEVLIPTDSSTPAFIEVSFPPQAVLEEILPRDGTPLPMGLSARFSGRTRLGFEVPLGAAVPFTPSGLLSWAGFLGSPDRTLIECVWDLVFRELPSDARWSHSSTEVTPEGVNELWQTTLVARQGEGRRAKRKPLLGGARSAGFSPSFRTSLEVDQRRRIAVAVEARPLVAHELTFSSRGATVDLIGDWTDIPELSLTMYRHSSTLGREARVATVEQGYLLPFGFPAQLDSYTERQLRGGQATLVQTVVLTVHVAEISYEGAIGLPFEGREFPFRVVRLDDPLVTSVTKSALAGGISWLDTTAGSHLGFRLTAEDFEGHLISFSAPAAFVPRDQAFGGEVLRTAVEGYDAQCKTIPLPVAGQVALAPPGLDPTAVHGTSVVDVEALYIGGAVANADPSILAAQRQLGSFPKLAGVDARIPALEAFTRGATSRARTNTLERVRGRAARLDLDRQYVESGLGASRGVYSKLAQAVDFVPPVTSSGSLAALSFPTSGLSRDSGLVGGDLEAFKSAGFDPQSFFPIETPELLPILLGVVELDKLVEPTPDVGGAGAPQVLVETLFREEQGRLPIAVQAKLAWRPRLKVGFHGPGDLLETTANTTLDLRSTHVARFDGRPPTSEVAGELRSFSLTFCNGLLVVPFERLGFVSHSGGTPSLDVKVGTVGFGGDLRFLNSLSKFLSPPENGPRVAVTAAAIEASHTIAVPDVSMGVFLLQNLAVSASLSLPLDRRPVRMRFAVSKRDDPFLVTISLFGGGGFIDLELELEEIVRLEAGIAFGAAASLDLKVASASVIVTAEIHFLLEAGRPKLDGFFRAVGELDVLGIVNVSVEIYLGLALSPPPTKEVTGYAMFSVRIRVAFFSKSLTLSAERKFSAGSDPTFDVAFASPEPWLERCAAFASMSGP